MNPEGLTNPTVRAAVIAIRDGDRDAFLALFESDAKLTDDGEPQSLLEWVDRELFTAHGRLDVQREQQNGLELIGRFHSDQWNMMTVWRFEIVNRRVRRLDVAAL